MRIQLLTFPGCPCAAATRELLANALASVGAVARIEEVDTTAQETPEILRGWGSPTVLVDGADIAGAQTPSAMSCRLYVHDDGRLRGVPPEALFVRALRDRAG